MIKDASVKSAEILKTQIKQPVKSLIRIQNEISKHEECIKEGRFPAGGRSKQDGNRRELHVAALNATEILDMQIREHICRSCG